MSAETFTLSTKAKDALSRSDPERLSKTIRSNDGLSTYCDFYGYTREKCADDLVKNPARNDSLNSVDAVYHKYLFFLMSDEQLAMAIGYSLLALLSFVATSGFVFLLLKQGNDFRYPIYSIIMHLSISYSLIAFSQVFVDIPLHLFAVQANDLIGRIALFIDQLAIFGAVFFYFILAINRLAILSCYRLNFLFKGKQKNRTIASGWILSLGAAVFTLYYGCRKTYDSYQQTFYDECTPTSLLMYTAYKILFYIYYALPVISFLLYIYIGISISFTRKKCSHYANRKVEVDLLVQSAVTLLFYMAMMSLYFLQFEFTARSTVYIYELSINILEVLTGIIFVSIFAIGNRTVKKAARNMLKRNGSVMPVKIPIVFNTTNNTPSVEFPGFAHSR